MAALVTAGAGLVTPAPVQAGLFGLSESQEQQIGRDAALELERKYGLVTDSRLNSLVQGIGADLVSAGAKRKLPYRFRILNEPGVNAVTLPGGYIYVFRGLLDFVRNDPQTLAGVLAHEIGHAEGKHHSKMMERQMLTGTLLGALTKGKTQQLASLFTNIYGLKWGRSQEYDADKRGVQLAAAAGFNPEGLVSFLDRLGQSGGSRGPSWLATHPAPADRVRKARSAIGALGARSYNNNSAQSSRYSGDRYSYDGRSTRDDYADDRYTRGAAPRFRNGRVYQEEREPTLRERVLRRREEIRRRDESRR